MPDLHPHRHQTEVDLSSTLIGELSQEQLDAHSSEHARGQCECPYDGLYEALLDDFKHLLDAAAIADSGLKMLNAAGKGPAELLALSAILTYALREHREYVDERLAYFQERGRASLSDA